jgi:hypothetical protein
MSEYLPSIRHQNQAVKGPFRISEDAEKSSTLYEGETRNMKSRTKSKISRAVSTK